MKTEKRSKKMKTVKTVLLIVLSFLFLLSAFACGDGKESETAKKEINKGHISISYPEFKNTYERDKEINDLLYDLLMENDVINDAMSENAPKNVLLKVDYEIKQASDALISVVYKCTYADDAAQTGGELLFVIPVNVDPVTATVKSGFEIYSPDAAELKAAAKEQLKDSFYKFIFEKDEAPDPAGMAFSGTECFVYYNGMPLEGGCYAEVRLPMNAETK